MTIDEAIEHCLEKGNECSECGKEHLQLAEWLKENKELKEKQTSKKPNKFDGYFCSSCNKKLARNTDLVNQEYCHHCGQKLKWD